MSFSQWERIVVLNMEERRRVAKERQLAQKARSLTGSTALQRLGRMTGAMLIGLGKGVQALGEEPESQFTSKDSSSDCQTAVEIS